jgi:hypothetical protein
MGYVTLILSESELIEGGKLIDQGTEQTRDRLDALAVTLHEEDLKCGTFVLALRAGGRIIPHTWTSDAGNQQAVQWDGTQYGGTLEQFEWSCSRQARFALVQGFAPRVATHVPREQLDGVEV